MITETESKLFVGGRWVAPHSERRAEIRNPATAEVLGVIPLGDAGDVAAAVAAAAAAYPDWRRTPPGDRVQFLFRFKELLERHFEELAALITREHGKILAESRGELRRGIENVETACGIPALMQGYNLEDVARGIDETMIRQPLGVVAAITPFNFPAMIPLWFLPYAIACGNTMVLKPSEKTPLTVLRLAQLLEETGLPPGVLNVVTGAREAADALLVHPQVRAISFVGSTPVARHVYATASAHGKRVQCQGGAKNYVVVMPDADLEMSSKIIGESAFGCSGQRCLAVSVAVAVGAAREAFRERMVELARSLRVGDGLDESVQMGPVISHESKSRIEALIGKGEAAGGRVLVDGRGTIEGFERGSFVKPTVIEDVPPASGLQEVEIFGPVLTLERAASLEEAIAMLAASAYGNAASIFTTSGAAARKFRYETPAGNIGVNIGVPAPMASFPFSGWKDSFLGVLHGQGRDAVQFYTEQKVVIERWPAEWSRRF